MASRITVLESPAQVDRAVAWEMIHCMLENPSAVLGLAAGSTTDGIHQTLADIWRSAPFDISDVRFFGLDEIVMVPEDYDETCIADFQRDLIEPMGIRLENMIMPPSQSDDYQAEAARYASRIKALGQPDLAVLGIGIDGHLGMNLPGTPFDSGTRLVMLGGELEQRLRKSGKVNPGAPIGGITLGIRDLMNMPRLLLVAKGAKKAEIIARALEGPVTEAVPASVLQLHPSVRVYLDREASSRLTKK